MRTACIVLAVSICGSGLGAATAQDASEPWPPAGGLAPNEAPPPQPPGIEAELEAIEPDEVEEQEIEADTELDRGHREDRGPFGEEHLILQAFWLPVIGMETDEDRTGSSGLELEADVATGSGFGALVAVGTRKDDGHAQVGLLYLHGEHEERERDSQVETHGVYLEGLLGIGAWEEEWAVEPGGYIAIGVGAAGFDFREHFHDRGSAALEIRAAFGLTILDCLEALASAGYFVWGYPGETLGRGGFILLGGGLQF